MTSRLLAITMAVALLAFSAVPSFADHHGGGRGGGGGGWHGGGGNWNGGVAGIMVVTVAAGELDRQ
jgi:hypothetical protein